MELSCAILEDRLRRPFRYCESVGSTNDLAKTWFVEGAPEGAVVIANEQMHGRGRNGRIWRTPPDVALALSVILCPPTHAVSRMYMLGALAVYDLAETVGCEEIGIKWPNDVQVNGKKVAGILPEAVWQEDRVSAVILGIGVNVRVDFDQTEFRDSAISLESAVDRRLDRADLLQTLLQSLDYWYARVSEELAFRVWKERLNMLGKRVSGYGAAGIALDVTPEGNLLVAADDGDVRMLTAGELRVCDELGQGE